MDLDFSFLVRRSAPECVEILEKCLKLARSELLPIITVVLAEYLTMLKDPDERERGRELRDKYLWLQITYPEYSIRGSSLRQLQIAKTSPKRKEICRDVLEYDPDNAVALALLEG